MSGKKIAALCFMGLSICSVIGKSIQAGLEFGDAFLVGIGASFAVITAMILLLIDNKKNSQSIQPPTLKVIALCFMGFNYLMVVGNTFAVDGSFIKSITGAIGGDLFNVIAFILVVLDERDRQRSLKLVSEKDQDSPPQTAIQEEQKEPKTADEEVTPTVEELGDTNVNGSKFELDTPGKIISAISICIAVILFFVILARSIA